MDYMNLCTDSAVLKIFKRDCDNGSAEYEEFLLDGVKVQEKRGSDPDMTKNNAVCVYFFHTASKCTDSRGKLVQLPRPKYGDLCIIHPNDGNETALRVSSVEYHSGVSPTGGISHVKIILR